MGRSFVFPPAGALLLACGAHEPSTVPSPMGSDASSVRSAPPAAALPPFEIAAISAGGTWLCPVGQIKECATRCEAGNALSCARLAQAKPEPAEARSTFARSCELGYPVACASFAEMLALGVGGPSDVKLALRLFAGSCEHEVARGCFGLAAMTSEPGLRERSFERACALGDSMACIEATQSNDSKGLLRGMRRALQPAVSASAAASALGCAAGTTGFESVALFGAVELYCAKPDGEKQGPFITWASREDLVEGEPHGVMRERGSYARGRKEGSCEAWDMDGKVRAKGSYKNGREHGDWELINVRGNREIGRFNEGLREGPWTEWRGGSTVEVGYARGKREGRLVERSSSGTLTMVEEWRDGMRQGTQTTTWEGTQTCVVTFVDDKKVGASVCRDPTGRIIP